MGAEKLERLKLKLCDELEGMAAKDITVTNLETICKLASTVKDLCKIIMMEDEGGESQGDWEANGSYDGGMSGRRMHYVRGHYSRADGMSRRSYSRDGMSRNSYGGSNDRMMMELEEAMDAATTEHEREAIRKLMDKMG